MLRVFTCLFCLFASMAHAEITVFAAASLRGVLEEVNETAPGPVTVSYASSAALARQIAQGAPADVFLSANTRWVDWLADQPASNPLQAEDFLGNSLVLIGPLDQPDIEISQLPTELEGQFLAMGHDRAVPAGIYAREALTSLGLWADLRGNILQTDNVRAALRLVALGEVPFAVTYATDAMAEPRVKVLHRFVPEHHSPITYRLASFSDSPEVQGYLTHLSSPNARENFRAHGFQDIAE
ncbi:molybdate ABC transporter substrate-binding protein [Cognatishimia sp.]|uniref:molybdate ABC transporter substrate-binding protein n=1 Tax=Cognatishimia sp. TaxID=2211648 RepID=UPI0035166682|nr:molybdate ABC transporter substrate-binding protein [Cognatishimia sp.]